MPGRVDDIRIGLSEGRCAEPRVVCAEVQLRRRREHGAVHRGCAAAVRRHAERLIRQAAQYLPPLLVELIVGAFGLDDLGPWTLGRMPT
jgi:hypothetical protein